MRASSNLSTASGIGAILLWSTTFAVARSLSEQIGPLTAGAATYLVGGSMCLIQRLGTRPHESVAGRLSRKYLIGCGALFAFYSAAIYLAVGWAKNREQLLEIALVNYLWPAFTILLSVPLLKKKARLWVVPGTVLALLGVFLVMTQGVEITWASARAHLGSNLPAYALTFAAAVSWALYSNLARRWSNPGSRGGVEWFIVGTGILLLAMRFATKEPAGWSVRTMVEVVGLAAVTSLAYGLWDLAMRRGNLLLVAVCSYFTPLLSTVVSSVYLHVAPGPRLWAGCLLIVLGSLTTWRSVSDETV